MAITGISALEEGEYICKDDPCKTLEEGATVFRYGNIASAVMARIHDMQATSTMNFAEQTQQFQQRNSAKNREAFRFGVKGWDNFLDDKGVPIEFKTTQILEGGKTYTVVSDESLDRVRLDTMNEVGQYVFNQNSLGEDKRKKFEELSSLFADTGGSSAKPATKTRKRGGAAKAAQPKGRTGATPSAKTT